jgi:hypothetical protein
MFIFLAGGCVCAYLAADSCEFFSYTSKEPDQLPEPFFNVTTSSVGLFGYYFDETDDSCTHYDNQFIHASDNDGWNAYFVTAQFAAVIGPSCAALAWIINLIEWLFWSNQCTYVLVVILLMMGFTIQGLTFMIYGQQEFWYVIAFVSVCPCLVFDGGWWMVDPNTNPSNALVSQHTGTPPSLILVSMTAFPKVVPWNLEPTCQSRPRLPFT